MAHRESPRLGFWYRLAVVLVRPLLMAFTKREWRGLERLPRNGGVLIVANHLSPLDPMTVAHVLYDNGRPPRFLAKASLFTVPVVGRLIRGAGQIPVYRQTKEASSSMRAAEAALDRGECVVVYPEGTLTRDPELWPMVGKTGAARVALAKGIPVIPLGHWGTQAVWPPYQKFPRPLPRKTIRASFGEPVDLSDLMGEELTAEVLRTATERIMAAITQEVASVRGTAAPATRFDPRTAKSAKSGESAESAESGESGPAQAESA